MSALVYRITYLLQMLLDHVPIGTNRGLLQLLLVLLSGRLLNSRGALFPALSDLGLDAPEVRRAEAALTYGRFDTNELVTVWQKMVLAEGRFHPHEFEGYRPVACDLTGFFRPQLQNLIGKHFHAASDRALPAVSLGMVAAVGSVGTKRLALARVLLTPQEGEKSEKELRLRTLRRAAEGLAAQEVLIVDAEFEVSELKQAGVARFVARAAANFTAPRNYPPAYKGHGPHPQYGETVRPLERAYRDKVLASTPPDAVARWKVGKRHVKAFLWEDLVGSEQKPGETCVRCVAIFDPKYKHPLVLVTNLAITAYALWCLYTDRWPIEQLPLAAKQMLGAARSLVCGGYGASPADGFLGSLCRADVRSCASCAVGGAIQRLAGVVRSIPEKGECDGSSAHGSAGASASEGTADSDGVPQSRMIYR